MAFRPSPKQPPAGDLREDIDRAHAWSIAHRASIEGSARCGCFCCLACFEPAHIVDWVDVVDGVAVTALCPACHIDAVIGDASGFPIEVSFLTAMQRRWF